MHSTHRAAQLRALAAALAIVAVFLLAMAPRALADSSEPHCMRDGRTYNACISFDDRGAAFGYDVHVGLDVYLPEQYGREIIACGGDFKATLRGDDGKGERDQVIRTLAIAPGWPQAGAAGIGAELVVGGVRWDDLDEDEGHEMDELYARVSFFDCHTGLTRQFRTGTIRGDYR